MCFQNPVLHRTLLYLNRVRVSLHSPFIITSFKVPQLDRGVLEVISITNENQYLCGSLYIIHHLKGIDSRQTSDAEIMMEKTGWKMTRVTGALCPDNSNFSGGLRSHTNQQKWRNQISYPHLGIHSLGLRFSRVGAPDMNSFSASDNFPSSSFT